MRLPVPLALSVALVLSPVLLVVVLCWGLVELSLSAAIAAIRGYRPW